MRRYSLIQLRVVKYLVLRSQGGDQGEVHRGDVREGGITEHPNDVGTGRVLKRSTHVTTVEIRVPKVHWYDDDNQIVDRFFIFNYTTQRWRDFEPSKSSWTTLDCQMSASDLATFQLPARAQCSSDCCCHRSRYSKFRMDPLL